MTTTTTAKERLAAAEAKTHEATAAFDKAVAALLAVGSEVTHNLYVLSEEITEEALTFALDNVEHLARLGKVAGEAKRQLADAAFIEMAARDEVHQAFRDESRRSFLNSDRMQWHTVPPQVMP
jgi:hypothetical protein